MKNHRKRKCRHCQDLFRPDPRNLRHQKHCSKPECRKASKAESQRRWLSKPDNRDYFRGTTNVQRVRDWRMAHPGYWRRKRSKANAALQDDSLAQPLDIKGESPTLAQLALQDFMLTQPFVLLGLIANLTDSTLQEAMPNSA